MNMKSFHTSICYSWGGGEGTTLIGFQILLGLGNKTGFENVTEYANVGRYGNPVSIINRINKIRKSSFMNQKQIFRCFN